MFTGIVETLGQVISIQNEGTNRQLEVKSSIGKELKIDQSLSHNGVCLTVTKVDEDRHWVTAIGETLKRSNLGLLHVGDAVNLERCMLANGRYDGHIVQGHVDITAEVVGILEVEGSWLVDFHFGQTDQVLVDKGSITVNGVSLTCFNVKDQSFRVAIIPYTYAHTNFGQLKVGSKVNLEFDILGKYVTRLMKRS